MRQEFAKCFPTYNRDHYSLISVGKIIMFVEWRPLDWGDRTKTEEIIFLFDGKIYATTPDVDSQPQNYLEEIIL